MSNLSEDIIRETFSGVAKAIGVRIDISDEMITDLAATLQTEIDRLEAAESEGFEFLNELALAFRAAENHPRPQCAPVLEGVRAVLAHLDSTGRLIPAGGMALTAEPAAVRDGSDLVVVQRSHTAKAVQSWMTLDLWTDLGKDDKDFDAEYERQGFGDLWATLLGEVRALVQATTPAPAEPAEEETKADSTLEALRDLFNGGPDTVIRTTWHDGVEYWEVPADDMRKILSSPVVPAPTETEWRSLNDVPPTVRKVKDVKGHEWLRRDGSLEWLGCGGPWNSCRVGHLSLAPFVAAEEG